ncbi:hypothetical protein [Nostoc sp.]|uniref:hypothetical protein n=1 Tax=Nostoc sp. TaxID=1180 RepID=UPI002FF86D05
MSEDDKVYVPNSQWTPVNPPSVIATGATTTPTKPVVTAATPSIDSLPDGFDPFEHLQQVYIPQHNAIVKLYFKDLPTDWKPNIATARSSLCVACTMLDSDNQLMMNLRHHLLFDLLGYGRSGLSIFYGSKENYDPPVVGHPKIVFYFSQDIASVPVGGTVYDAECSVRLMKLQNTSENLLATLKEIAGEIKTKFVHEASGIIHAKGNLCISYHDTINGFPKGSKILANSETSATNIYQLICDCIDIVFDETKITVHDPKKLSTVGIPTATQIIMGKTRKLRAYRPVVNVRFRYAYAIIPGNPSPTFLIDTTHRYKPLVKI